MKDTRVDRVHEERFGGHVTPFVRRLTLVVATEELLEKV
jgi:hypothetical protein